MSRLDSMIRRLTAQRAAIDWAAETVNEVDGDVLECGLGNGRTYDHLREKLPERRIFVIERDPAPHRASMPPEQRLLVGDAEPILDDLLENDRRFALINYDFGTDDADHAQGEAAALAERMADLLAPGGVLLSVQPIPPLPELERLPREATGVGERVSCFQRIDSDRVRRRPSSRSRSRQRRSA